MLIKSMKMFWESFSRRLFQNVEQKPGFQKTITIRKHLDIGRNNCHRCDADVPGDNECVEQNNKRVKSV